MIAEPTPRTDAFYGGDNPDMLPWIDFARQLERELSLAQSRLAEVEKDAARYRWLRNDSEKHFVPAPTGTMRSGVGIKVIYDFPTVKVPCTAMLDGDNLDAAIDEAIKRSSA